MRSKVLIISAVFFSPATCSGFGVAFAQTAAPRVMPPSSAIQSSVDRLGIDRSSGTVADVKFESVALGNKYSGLEGKYGSEGTLNHTAYLELERVAIYNGGLIVARVNARGTTHVFALGTITRVCLVASDGPCFKYAWGYNAYINNGNVFGDYHNDGALLSCPDGDPHQMYRSVICSLYLPSDGSRTDFKMPSSLYRNNLLDYYRSYSTANQVVYAWPTQAISADGEILSYIYRNYGEYNYEEQSTPAPSKWNAVDSSLGFRIYLSSANPTHTSNPGAMTPPTPNGFAVGGALYAINTAAEYADSQTADRVFSPLSSASVVASSGNGLRSLTTNGILIGSTALSDTGLTITKPGGGIVEYRGLTSLPPYQTRHASGVNDWYYSTPSGAFPSTGMDVTEKASTKYRISVDNYNYRPERYFGTVSLPDGVSEKFEVQFGLLQSETDGLGRKTSYTYDGQEGVVFGIPGYAAIARLSKIDRPDGSSVSYTYSHGAISSQTITPSDGSAAVTTTVGLEASCTVQNYRVCNKPVYIRDPAGRQTDFTYDPAHGGILTETRPADSAGVRAQVRYSYSQLAARVLNASGQLVSAPPVWRLTRSSECASAVPGNSASCVGTAAEHVTTFSYDSNNLFLTAKTEAMGDGSQARTTRYTYDYAGNQTSVRGPRTDIDDTSYTTFDRLRRKVMEIGPDPDGGGPLLRQMTRHVYDMDGNEVRTEYGKGSAVDGSDFAMSRFNRMTYDSVTGAVIKRESVVP